MKEFESFIYVERDNDGYVEEEFYVIYVGEGLSSKYQDDWFFWLWIDRPKVWERHAIEKRADLTKTNDEENRKIIGYIFESKGWPISS